MDPIQFFPDFIGQAMGVIIDEIIRNLYLFKVLKFFNFIKLALDITLVFDLNFHLGLEGVSE